MTSQFEQLLIEALSDTQKELIDTMHSDAQNINAKTKPFDEKEGKPESLGHQQHDELFYKHTGNANSERLVSPISSERTNIEPAPVVKLWLEKNGYSTDKYHDKVASRIEENGRGEARERVYRIGGLLQKSAPSHIRKAFESDPAIASSKNEMQMVVSREKYDIGGMTSGRRWNGQSCMRLPGDDATHPESLARAAEGSNSDLEEYKKQGGAYHKKIKDDFVHGTLVGYFTKKGDDEAHDPAARVLFKKMVGVNESGDRHVIFRPEGKVYGSESSSFKKHAEKFANENWPSKEGYNYEMSSGLYHDTSIGFEHFADGKHEKGNEVYYYKNSKLHSPDNNTPSEKYETWSGSTVSLFHNEGVIHRDGDKPAQIKTDQEGNVELERYWKNGLQHRDGDKPAEIIKKDNRTFESWMQYGIAHRDGDKPSYVEKDKDGIIRTEHHKYGLLHTDTDTPSYSDYDSKVFQWHKHGDLHRDGDMPAEVMEGESFDYNHDQDMNERLLLWKKNDVHSREGGKPTYEKTSTSSDGTHRIVEHKYINEAGQFKNPLGNHLPIITKQEHYNKEVRISHVYKRDYPINSDYKLYSNADYNQEKMHSFDPEGRKNISIDQMKANDTGETHTTIHIDSAADKDFPNASSISHRYTIDHSGNVDYERSVSNFNEKHKETHHISNLPEEHKNRIREALNHDKDHVGFIDGVKKRILGE